MSTIIRANGLSKSYGSFQALKNVNFTVERGKIVGLVGPNGAGKTTILKAILGLTSYSGELDVLGLEPSKQRHQLMQKVCFIADVAVLPKWMKVKEAVEFVTEVHPHFNLDRAKHFLNKTNIKLNSKVKELSKGMVAQLHLALVMSIEAELLVLDEPTLGLDILYRKEFYNQLLAEFFDEGRSILVTTHQIEEVENLLTDLIFIRDGEIVLDSSMEEIGDKYVEVMVSREDAEKAKALNPVMERDVFGRKVYLFEGVGREQLEALGELHSPSVADLFVAKMKEGK
ncbi:ABC transporter ATP-binding protein [Aliikangiella coralliicola]|uniref:ABC transporter ATP-binding protein n=1 Tax=Aliikangiella coralliicola TaxID=2592383 RepID=A0A545UDE2_9GAMM|nr:ABC transporter ATP-binding protein [Aliikangiella coralliicola]TQV87480.1 ABC transporter ATP-binding protein [Aliikangiella coralliicola]